MVEVRFIYIREEVERSGFKRFESRFCREGFMMFEMSFNGDGKRL